jgi:hypothetical protein
MCARYCNFSVTHGYPHANGSDNFYESKCLWAWEFMEYYGDRDLQSLEENSDLERTCIATELSEFLLLTIKVFFYRPTSIYKINATQVGRDTTNTGDLAFTVHSENRISFFSRFVFCLKWDLCWTATLPTSARAWDDGDDVWKCIFFWHSFSDYQNTDRLEESFPRIPRLCFILMRQKECRYTKSLWWLW